VTKFLMVSYIASRRNRAPWWTDQDWATAQRVNNEILPHYHKAKVEADEYLTAVAKKRVDSGDSNFRCIILRPGTLTDADGQGKVLLGKTPSSGKIPRADVAAVAVKLLERDQAKGWYDLLEGNDSISKAVDDVIQNGVDCIEGEDLERIYAKV
jgi:nucleoside-diphosphate-sugar epimerase